MYAFQTNIYVTDRCVKHCPTCYYTRSIGEMSRMTAYVISQWTAELCKNENVQQYRAHFLGGEPFNNYEVMLYLIEHLEDKLPEHSNGAKEGKYVVFTNGDNLQPSRLRRLKHWRARLMLNPTYDNLDMVEEKVKHIKSHMGGCSLAVCLDDYNLNRAEELAKLAIRHKCHLRFNRLYNGGAIPGYVERYGAAMHKVLDLLLNSDFIIWPNFIIESTTFTWDSPKNPNFCGKCFMAIDPDGTMRSCNADPDAKIGSVFISKPKMSEFTFTHRWSAKNLPECQDCEWVTWCQGGCPYSRKLAYGTYNKRTPFCGVFKELFPKLQKIKERWIKHNGLDR